MVKKHLIKIYIRELHFMCWQWKTVKHYAKLEVKNHQNIVLACMCFGDLPCKLTKHSVAFADFALISYSLADLGKGSVFTEWAANTDAWQTEGGNVASGFLSQLRSRTSQCSDHSRQTMHWLKHCVKGSFTVAQWMECFTQSSDCACVKERDRVSQWKKCGFI